MPIIINNKEEAAKVLNGKPVLVTFYCISDLEVEYCITVLYTDPLSFKIETQKIIKDFLRAKKIYGTITIQWYPIAINAVIACKDNTNTVVLQECCFNCSAEESNGIDLVMHANGNKYCKSCMEKL